ncbi:MAG: hypothetical protein MK189_06600 [Acidimicrobiales bacterium]|nr:hypothetical protein [Acidimicrobiales bacterium]
MRNSEARGTRSRWILLAAVLMVLGACGGGGGEDDVAETTPPARAGVRLAELFDVWTADAVLVAAP